MTVPTPQEHEVPAPEEKKVGPGALLREAREARRLTLEAAANQLHVDPALLRALEADQYDQFAAPIFVTGHLRAYARLLDLPPGPVVEAYHKLGHDEPPPLKQVSRRITFNSGSSLLPGVTVTILLLVAIAVFAVLQNGGRDAAVTTDQAAAPDAGNALALPETPAAAPPPEDGDAGAPAESAPAAPVADPAAKAAAAAPPAAAEPEALLPAAPAAAAGERATLSLKADRASWVEVRDANGRRLLYDLLDPGTSRNVEGLAPFAVLLGYGRGVTVEFNGKLIDHARYVHQDVARFRIGENGIDKL